MNIGQKYDTKFLRAPNFELHERKRIALLSHKHSLNRFKTGLLIVRSKLSPERGLI